MENLKVIDTKFEKIVLFGLLIVIYFVFFQHLDSFHIRNWDESMYAVNAYEMDKNGQFITPYFKNLPDLWNSKPPFLLWLQVVFIKLIGFNELAIRLPSAIASCISAYVLYFFLKKRSDIYLAISVCLVFITSSGVCTFHTGRTGDADSLLSLFILLSLLSFYKILFENNIKSMLYFFAYLTLAFLTKSVAALLFLPGLIIATFYFKKVGLFLTEKYFYAGLFVFLSSVISFIYLREMNNPGYFNYLISVDLGRVGSVVESHNEPFDFYLNNLFFYRFTYFLFVLPGVFLLYINNRTKLISVYVLSLIVTYFLIISISVTKLEWYDLPLFPIVSFCSGYVIYVLIKQLHSKTNNKRLVLGAYLIFFILPTYFAIRQSFKNEIPTGEKQLEILSEYAFKNKNNNELNNTLFYTNVFERPLYFYKYYINTKNADFNITNELNDINIHSIVIVANDTLKNRLNKKFKTQVISTYKSVTKYQIINSNN